MVHLSSLPRKVKWLFTFALMSFLLNHAFAFALVREVTTNIDPSAKEHFAYKSLAVLLRMGHQHAFGHGVMYFITGGIFSFADVAERISIALIASVFVAAWLDIAGWFLLKYGSARWELLSMASGTTYAFGFTIMAGVSLVQMWRPRQ